MQAKSNENKKVKSEKEHGPMWLARWQETSVALCTYILGVAIAVAVVVVGVAIAVAVVLVVVENDSST
jgi:hypothetical protein